LAGVDSTKGPDALTRWWRRISLRAKVTGVTVAVLTLGLLGAGIGTVPILTRALSENIDSSLHQLAASAVGERLFNIADYGDGPVFTPKANPAPTEYFVAIYGPDGTLLATAGGAAPGEPRPRFDAEIPLDYAYANQGSIIELPGTHGEGDVFHAALSVVQFPTSNNIYTQVVARPMSEVDDVVGTYLGIFLLVSLVTIFAGAVLTRGAVTLTFRRFGQVEATAMNIAAGDFSQRLTDIEPRTEIGRLKSAINTMLDRIDDAIAERDATVRKMRRFVGDASHELRTPLVSVRGYAELYRMGAIQEPEETARAMERIEKEAIRMGALVEDLLALARLDEKREVDLQPLDLRPIAHDAALDVGVAEPGRVISAVDTTIEALTGPIRLTPAPETTAPTDTAEPSDEHQHRLARSLTAATEGLTSLLRRKPKAPGDPDTAAIDVVPQGASHSAAPVPTLDFTVPQQMRPVAVPPIVLAEEHRVRQVVSNLLGNARRYSPDGSPIEIEVGVDAGAGMGWIAVVDHGEGVPEEIRGQIFERFWRADTSRARETGGSGLGLSIVASIVATLHGTVTVLETPGGGATFRVALPLAPPVDDTAL